MAYTLDIPISLGSGSTGLTLRFALRVYGGTLTAKDLTTIEEIGGGNYHLRYTSFPDDWRGVVVIYTGTIGGGTDFSGVTIQTQVGINPQETEYSDAKVSTRASQTSVDTLDDYVDTEVAAIKAKTDNLPTSPAAIGSAMTLANGAITEATIATPAETAGRPTGLLAMMRRVFEWAANKRTRDRSTGTVLLRNAADDGTLETQTQSTSGDVDTQTKGA